MLRALVALALAFSLPLSALPFSPQPATTSAQEGWDYAADRDRLLPTLPDEPATAAAALVELIYGENFEVATFATTELLRRSGLPLVNFEGQVAALPDGLVLLEAPVQGEFMPALARSVRAGDFYTVEEFNDLLVDADVFEEPLPLDALLGGLGRWGKGPNDPAAVAAAGTAVRALGAKRGHVYYALADPEQAQLDPMQVVILFSHLAADAFEIAETASLSPLQQLLGIRVARAAGSEGCVRALEEYENFTKPPAGIDKQTWEFFLEAVKEASGVDLSVPNPADAFKKKKGIDRGKVSAVITTLLWITGIRMTIEATPAQTHFRHKPGEGGKNVTVTATARFDYPLSKQGAACLKLLADVDAFPQGRLPGFKVRWSIQQPLNKAGTGKLLRALAGQGQQFTPAGTGGDTTDGNGQSKVVFEPAVERSEGRGKEVTERATVIASLDKDDFPFKMKDLLGLKDPRKFAIDKVFDLANSAIRRLGLPKQQVVVPVTYHGTEILKIEGRTTLYALYWFLPLYVDLYTCDGLKGEWKGTAGFAGERNFLGDAADRVLGPLIGRDIPEQVELERQERFLLDLTRGFDRAVILQSMGLDVEINQSQWNRGWQRRGFRRDARGHLVALAGQNVGTATLTIGGQPASILAIFDSRSATFDVRRYSPDDFENNAEGMCPGAGDGGSYFP